MRESRRRALFRIIEVLAVGLILLDLVVYFVLIRPMTNLRAAEDSRYAATREHVRQLRVRVARLENFRAALPDSENQLDSFYRSHIPPRRQGFSRAARLLRRLTERAGLHLVSIAYKLDPSEGKPLRRLGLEVDAEGSFSSVLSFSHALETADDLIVVRNFTLEPTESRTVALRLAADLYLKP